MYVAGFHRPAPLLFVVVTRIESRAGSGWSPWELRERIHIHGVEPCRFACRMTEVALFYATRESPGIRLDPSTGLRRTFQSEGFPCVGRFWVL
jgi:hypothetical protein